jgi:hypothetical protein
MSFLSILSQCLPKLPYIDILKYLSIQTVIKMYLEYHKVRIISEEKLFNNVLITYNDLTHLLENNDRILKSESFIRLLFYVKQLSYVNREFNREYPLNNTYGSWNDIKDSHIIEKLTEYDLFNDYIDLNLIIKHIIDKKNGKEMVIDNQEYEDDLDYHLDNEDELKNSHNDDIEEGTYTRIYTLTPVKKKKVITVDYQYLQIYDIEFIDSIITIIVKIFSYDIYNIKNTEYDYLKKFINTDYIILFDSHSVLN